MSACCSKHSQIITYLRLLLPRDTEVAARSLRIRFKGEFGNGIFKVLQWFLVLFFCILQEKIVHTCPTGE